MHESSDSEDDVDITRNRMLTVLEEVNRLCNRAQDNYDVKLVEYRKDVIEAGKDKNHISLVWNRLISL